MGETKSWFIKNVSKTDSSGRSGEENGRHKLENCSGRKKTMSETNKEQ